MFKKIFRNLFFIFLFGGTGLLIWQAVNIRAEDRQEPEQKIWIGTITIEETGSAFLDEDNSTKDYIATYFKESKIHDKVTLSVCGPGGPLQIIDINRTYSEQHIKRSFSQRNHRVCSDLTRKEPGNSTRTEEHSLKTIYGGSQSSEMTEHKADLSIMPDGIYYLFVSSKVPVDTEMKSKSEAKHVCSGETIISEFHRYTCTPDEKGSSSISGQGTNHTKMTTGMPPIEKQLGGTLTGRMEDNTISGETVLFDDKPSVKGGLVRKGVATWNLQYIHGYCDCTAFVRMVKGDVKISGKAVKQGLLLDYLSGAEVETGPRSRIQIDFGHTMIRIGSNTNTTIIDPCGKEYKGSVFNGVLTRGKIYAIISRVTGSGSEFIVETSNAICGVRGDVNPLYNKESDKILLASLALPLDITAQINTQQEESIDETRPTQQEIDQAVIVFMVDNTPGKPLLVEAIKGQVEVEDSTGEIKILKGGKVFTKDWKPAEISKKIETVIVKAKVK